jgi:hypothetical protein
VIVNSAKPLVQQILAAPHRDISHLSFGDLLKLYAAGRQQAASASASTTNPTSRSGSVLVQDFDTLVNEWCLRSVFSSSWKEVDVDVPGLFMHLDHHHRQCQKKKRLQTQTQSTSRVAVEEEEGHTTSLTLLSQWPPSSSIAAGNEVSSVLTTSCFVGSIGSYHHLPVSSASSGVASASVGKELVRADGTKRIERVMASLRRHQNHQQSTGIRTERADNTPNEPIKTLWVPFSTLWDMRRCAFGGGGGGGGGALRRNHRPSPQDTLSLVGSLQLVRQALQLQHPLVQLSGHHRDVQLRVVPPTAEFAFILDFLRNRSRSQTNATPSSSSRSPSAAANHFGAEQLCESSLVRWVAMSRLFPSCALAVEGTIERRVALEYGDIAARAVSNARAVRGVLLEHHQQNGTSAATSSSSNSKQHQSVVTQCGDLSQKLARREQFVRAAPRY